MNLKFFNKAEPSSGNFKRQSFLSRIKSKSNSADNNSKFFLIVFFLFLIIISFLSLLEIIKYRFLNILDYEYQTLIIISAAASVLSFGAYFLFRKIERLKNFANELYYEKNELRDKYFTSQLEFEKKVEERNYELSEINDLLNLEIESRKKTEELLGDSERKYRLIYKHTPVGIFHYDDTLTINDFNEKFSKIFNGSRESFLNFNFSSIKDPNLISALKSGLEGDEGRFEGLITFPASGEYNISLTTAPLFNITNQISGGLGIVAPGKTNADSLNVKLYEREEESAKLKTEFLAQVTHEIRSPVHVILSSSDLLKSRLENEMNEDFNASLDIISKAGNRITRTLEMIIYMAEMQAGTYKYLPRFIDLYHDILMRIYFNFRKSAEEKEIKFNLIKKTDAAFIQVDENTVYQLFNNIVDNAIKYTSKGIVQITIFRDGSDNLTVSVLDTGIGISEEYMPYIFKSFSQEDKGYSREYEGSGLGMALAKKCCELNNAKLELESKKNVGSTFTVKFE
jgi:signal transduction histidine kinase